MANAGPDNGAGTFWKVLCSAVYRHNGCCGILGKGIVRTRWLNWIVFDHLLTTTTQSVKKKMSPRRKCFSGLNCARPLLSRLALRNNPKNATRQTAQKVA